MKRTNKVCAVFYTDGPKYIDLKINAFIIICIIVVLYFK